LERALRLLRDRLAAEGLFDPARKRPLPRYPRRVAFVTSPTGAAIRDFLEVLRRRWRGVDVLVVPVKVQGAGAAQEIAAAIARVNALADPVDVLVVGRGGGSLEDLWAFNEEPVVRAIWASRIPVVSAVGHDIDVTLSDLAADVRAATPSEAAELISPAADEVEALVRRCEQRLTTAMRNRLATLRSRLEAVAAARVFRRPLELVQLLAQSLDQMHHRAGRAIRHRLDSARNALQAKAGRLESLSPLAVLARGYSVTTRESDRQIVRDADSLSPGERVRSRFAQGQAISRVEEVLLSTEAKAPSGDGDPRSV
jgi:exodeoxyribonuclease VII large subunit